MSLHTAGAPVRTYGATDNAALDDTEGNPPSERREPGIGVGRVYFKQSLRRKSSSISRAFSRWKQVGDGEEGGGDGGDAEGTSEQALIPSALEHKGEPPTTPLPKLSMIVLSIVRVHFRDLYARQISNLTTYNRQCWASSCQQMCRLRSSCSWSKVRHCISSSLIFLLIYDHKALVKRKTMPKLHSGPVSWV